MRFPLSSWALLGGLLAASQAAFAQYDPTVAHRSVQAMELWPEVQGELALKNGDYLLLALRGEHSTSEYGSSANRPLGFDTRRVALAYEHFWNSHWSWGGTARYERNGRFETNTPGDMLVPELLLRHRSTIFGGLTFGQRLGVERQVLVNRQPIGGTKPDGQFWGRLRIDVERLFFFKDDILGFALRPRLSYSASTHLRLQKDANDPDERTIQLTSLRGEVGLRFSPRVDLTPWFAYQTVYRQDLVFTDATGTIPVSGGKINAIYPTLGLDLRFTLLAGGPSANRQQLPTQH